MLVNRRCVISGVGLATPAGSDIETFFSTLSQGQPLFEQLMPVEGAHRPEQVARVNDEFLDHGLTPRQLRKLDRFTILAQAATRGALADASYPLSSDTQERLGLLVGNCTAGWSYVEPMMYDLYKEGMDSISPYIATAWFPAAPQGEISIHHGIQGYSKTIAAERLSSGYALELSLWLIAAGQADAMIVGGAESPLSPLVLNSFWQGGQLSPKAKYRPFSSEADGFLLGEGAAMVVVEAQHDAQARNSPIYAEVLAIAKAPQLEQAMKNCLEVAGLSAQQIDYILLDASGNLLEDAAEYRAITSIFGLNSRVRMSAPKSMYGNIIGANMALDLVIACLSLQRQVVLPTAARVDTFNTPPTGIHVTNVPEYCSLNYVFINGRDNQGQSLVILCGNPSKSHQESAT